MQIQGRNGPLAPLNDDSKKVWTNLEMEVDFFIETGVSWFLKRCIWFLKDGFLNDNNSVI